MVFIFIVILAFCLIASVAAYKGRYPRQQEKWVLIGLIIALAGIGACVAPKSTYDLFRHYEVIDRVRNSSYSLSSFLVDGYRITDLNYKDDVVNTFDESVDILYNDIETNISIEYLLQQLTNKKYKVIDNEVNNE